MEVQEITVTSCKLDGSCYKEKRISIKIMCARLKIHIYKMFNENDDEIKSWEKHKHMLAT